MHYRKVINCLVETTMKLIPSLSIFLEIAAKDLSIFTYFAKQKVEKREAMSKVLRKLYYVKLGVLKKSMQLHIPPIWLFCFLVVQTLFRS